MTRRMMRTTSRTKTRRTRGWGSLRTGAGRRAVMAVAGGSGGDGEEV